VTRPDVLVVGGGLVGLGIGWELARAGAGVVLLERDAAGSRPTAAAWAAAGMLAPTAEAGFGEREQLALGSASLRLYPEWAAEVEAASGMGVDLRTEGTLIVGTEPDDRAWLDRVGETHRALGLESHPITGAEAREREPHLSPRVAAARFSPSDHQVDNRLLYRALREAFARVGGALREGVEVTRVAHEGGRATGVWLRPADGAPEELVEAPRTVVCAGAWTRRLLAEAPPPIRPVKGQILALRMSRLVHLDHVVRTRRVYLAPKSDGRLVVGATCEEQGFDTRITAGALMELLRDAWETVPGTYDLAVDETWAGLRPASRDHAPVLGPARLDGLFLATGHYRNGVLLTPITARLMRDVVLGGPVPELLRPFAPGRFHTPKETR
jgi:glycine oxidase